MSDNGSNQYNQQNEPQWQQGTNTVNQPFTQPNRQQQPYQQPYQQQNGQYQRQQQYQQQPYQQQQQPQTVNVSVNYQYAPTGKKPVSKVAYVLLALFLGGIGIHNFYAGKTGLGILYLLFCWTLIPGIAALVQAIIALCKPSDMNGNILV